jgi:hypothetical protein
LQPIFVDKASEMKDKIRVAAFVSFVFSRPAEKRTIPFAEIAAAAKISEPDVELLVLKAFAAELVKGSIDEVYLIFSPVTSHSSPSLLLVSPPSPLPSPLLLSHPPPRPRVLPFSLSCSAPQVDRVVVIDDVKPRLLSRFQVSQLEQKVAHWKETATGSLDFLSRQVEAVKK